MVVWCEMNYVWMCIMSVCMYIYPSIYIQHIVYIYIYIDIVRWLIDSCAVAIAINHRDENRVWGKWKCDALRMVHNDEPLIYLNDFTFHVTNFYYVTDFCAFFCVDYNRAIGCFLFFGHYILMYIYKYIYNKSLPFLYYYNKKNIKEAPRTYIHIYIYIFQ